MYQVGRSPVRVPIDPQRRAANAVLELTRSTMVPVTSIAEVDTTNLQALRDRLKPEFEAETGVPLTYTAFFARATALALKAVPSMNAAVTEWEHLYHPQVDLGIVVRNEHGILIPVIPLAEHKSIVDLAYEIAYNNRRAQAGQVSPEEMSTATFVITNPGRYGGTLFGTPAIMAPNVGILGFEAIQKRPVVLENDQIVARPMMYISLTADHRALDGADMIQFCNTVKQILEELAF